MKNYKKAIERMVRRGELVLHEEEDGKKVYKRPDPDAWMKDFLIDGVRASTLPHSVVREALEKWYAEGNADEEILD